LSGDWYNGTPSDSEGFGTYLSDRYLFLFWIPVSLAIDYLNFGKSRILIHVMSKRRLAIWSLLIFILLDFALGVVVFCAGYTALHDVLDSVTFHIDIWRYGAAFLQNIQFFSNYLLLSLYHSSIGISNLFWAGMVPSAWIWLYVASLFLSRCLIYLFPSLRRIAFILDVENRPDRVCRHYCGVVLGVVYFAFLVGEETMLQ